MTRDEALAALERMGTAQNRKVYARHGVTPPSFGVSYANLKTLVKKIKRSHALALALWESGNHDARVLATMIADPYQATEKLLDTWVKALGNYVLTDAFSAFAAETPHAPKKRDQWIGAKGEWVATAGWNLITRAAMTEKGTDDAYFLGHLETIESEIHDAKNRVRYAMNGALIAIGMRNATLAKAALAAAKEIGTVEVDHGETGCKTPDAAGYIKKAAARKKKAKARA